FTLPEGKTAGQVFGKRQGRNKNALGGSYLPITDVMVNRVGGLALRPSVTDHLICKTWNFKEALFFHKK
ncbi:hypothetical protein, partial [Escherichia coli]